jgi:integrase
LSRFARFLSNKVEDYIRLRRSLGHSFQKQAWELQSFSRFVGHQNHAGPLTQELALGFVLSREVTVRTRAKRLAVIGRFAEYLSIFDPQTEVVDKKAIPGIRLTPPPRILNDEELARLLSVARKGSRLDPLHGLALYTIIGLLASAGLRSGEAVRLDRSDVDLDRGILQVRRTKFRKDRLVPVHPTTRDALCAYAAARDKAYLLGDSSAFFLNSRGKRLSKGSLQAHFRRARADAGLDDGIPRALRLHDLRHRFAVTRIVTWYKEGVDVQGRLPVLATYLGHARYTDTAYYITGTAELLGLAAERAFGSQAGKS